MKHILITGGPVHAYLDAVKIITNRFKGGLMCNLAAKLLTHDTVVTYLCAPKVGAQVPASHPRLMVVEHRGFDDYHKKVLELAPAMDGVVLGAAVANLIPANPLAGKFPSHNYKPGDMIPIDFMIAPRVIDDVKRAAPGTHLFGFKLLSDVPHEELIRAAYGIVLEARATAVFANDEKKGLLQKYAVTKERGVHPLGQGDLAAWIWEMLNDEYYSTRTAQSWPNDDEEAISRAKELIDRYADRFTKVEGGLVFGTVAVRTDAGFITTARGKHELDKLAYVVSVDHAAHVVYSAGGKASLNAPLLARVFENPQVDYLVHYHEQADGLPTYPYAPPGSVRDTERPNGGSFNIKEHGCMLLFDASGKQL